jgi:ATP-dependent Clp protease ATP-binding subunit ClpB
MQVVRASFRPEFINRLDEIILFHRLFREHMDGIVDIQLKRLRNLLAEKGISIELDASARARLADAGYDPVYGARPLKRVIQTEIQNPLASLYLEGKVEDGDTVKISANKDGLTFNGAAAAEAA